MKNKIFVSIFISIFLIPQVTFASWWNPFTWNIFNKQNKLVTVQKSEATSTITREEEIEQPNLVSSTIRKETNNEFVLNVKKNIIKKTTPVIITTNEKISKSSVINNLEQEKIINTSQPITNINTDSIYDDNTKFDELGRKVFITQTPNYKLIRIVKAELETLSGTRVSGFFYKDNKVFKTEEDLNNEAKATQDSIDKEYGRGIYAQATTTTTSTQDVPVIYVTPTTASFTYLSAGYSSSYKAYFSIELRNMSDKIIEISSINYKINTDNSINGEIISVKSGKSGTVLDENIIVTGGSGFIPFTFSRPIVIFGRESINLIVEYPVKTSLANFDSSATRLSIETIETYPKSKFSSFPIEIKATLKR